MDPNLPISLGAKGVTRRDFLRKSLVGATASATLPGFLGHTFFGLDALAESQPPVGDEGPLLIVVQLSGGNDTLNTVVPYDVGSDDGGKSASEIYYEERPILSIPPENVLPLADGYGFHPSLPFFKQLWDDGELAIINGVGYPNPNLSHFASFDYWHTGRPDVPLGDGWLGRFFDHSCAGVGEVPPHLGVGMSPQLNRSLYSSNNRSGASMGDPERFKWLESSSDADPRSAEYFLRSVAPSFSSDPANNTLTYIQRTTHSALISSGEIKAAVNASKGFPNTSFPGSGFGTALADITTLIRGGLKTQVYYVEQPGYDTHFSQVTNSDPQILDGGHTDLLTALDQTLAAFVAELKDIGVWHRTMILTFSEFGRKIPENGSLGTDHGAAESLFVMGGGGVKPGFHGRYPSLRAEHRVLQNSMPYNVDFRRIYRTILQRWLGVSDANIGDILPAPPADGNFELLDFI